MAQLLTMITIEDFELNPSNYIWLQNGTIVIDSLFDKYFLGNKKLLLSCIEDNIKENNEGGYIDYVKVVEDYLEQNSQE